MHCETPKCLIDGLMPPKETKTCGCTDAPQIPMTNGKNIQKHRGYGAHDVWGHLDIWGHTNVCVIWFICI